MKWKKYFKLPFELDEFTKGYVWDANNQIVLDFPSDDEMNDLLTDEAKQTLVNCINNNTKPDYSFELELQNGTFYFSGIKVFQVRAWGYLTSPNCCNLSNEEATEIQDELGEYILKLLN